MWVMSKCFLPLWFLASICSLIECDNEYTQSNHSTRAPMDALSNMQPHSKPELIAKKAPDVEIKQLFQVVAMGGLDMASLPI